VPSKTVEDLLPEAREDWKYYEAADPDLSGYAGYFRAQNEVEQFAESFEAHLKKAD
jgi:hypothetical protein